MDPLEAILASMAAATGNAPAPTSSSSSKSAKLKSAASTTVPKPKIKKRTRDDSADADASHDNETYRLTFPDAPMSDAAIWNARIMHKLPDTVVQRAARAAKENAVPPPMEIARQQSVRTLCAKIKRASEEMGIAKLPNSTYETWQFTSKLTVAENDPLIPHAGSDYSGLLDELLKAGAPRAAAMRKCKELTKDAERLLRKFTQQDFRVGRKAVKRSQDDTMYHLTYGSSSVKLSHAHYRKLRDLYERHQCVSTATDASALRAFELALFSLLLRYDSLDGGGFQAALNEEVFDVLLERFGCQMECFASPLNCRYGRFCSAFADTDAPFGSVGSFFDFAPRAGCFEANPPFIPQLIKRMADHMTALLDAAEGPLAFIIVIPAWTDTRGWQQLHASRFNQHHERIPQRAHGYCEGKQHMRATRWRIASFDTSVFFWQNALAQRTWPVTADAIRALTTAFASKQAHERDALGLRKSGKRVKAVESTSSSKR